MHFSKRHSSFPRSKSLSIQRFAASLLGIATAFGLIHAIASASCFGQEKLQEIDRAHIQTYCVECHSGDAPEGGLSLDSISDALEDQDLFRKWTQIYDRIDRLEMPPKDSKQPSEQERAELLSQIKQRLLQAEAKRWSSESRTRLRRLTRAEYENTMRDLFLLPGIHLQNELPPDGSAHGFDKNADALDISHVNMAKYLEAADKVLDIAIAVQPEKPTTKVQRISLANPQGFVAHVLMHGDGVLLKNKQVDPEFPAPDGHVHIDQGAHERMGSFHNGASVGLFRHEDESFHPYFNEFVAIYPARYKLRTSLWSFQWDKGMILRSRGTEVARLSIVQLTGDGRGGGHPSSMLVYLDAPSLQEQAHEVETWLNPRETIGFNAASLVTGHTRGEGGVMNFTGPGIVCDYLDVEGPFYDCWPPQSHRVLFGDLPLVEFKQEVHPNVRPPKHNPFRQQLFMGKNQADPVAGTWTVQTEQPIQDAENLLRKFLPRAFRRPVSEEKVQAYVAQVKLRLEQGDCFEVAMRWAYRLALCSPDFLYHVEILKPNTKQIDDHSLANRLSYFLWNSLPDETLIEKANSGKLSDQAELSGEIERMLDDSKANRFVEDFLGQWLKLRAIGMNDVDRNLYPEFNVFLQDSMVLETKAYFREMLSKNLPASYLVKSDFAMLNEKLAVHYGIDGVVGATFRRVDLPPESPRGPFLTQAAILKITANGTTTSPVPRGAFVMDRLFGQPPEPPPANVAAVEPDVRGATTIREQLAKHRNSIVCASCHAKIDPPGFALEAFDVIGGQRDRYRSIGEGEPAPRGKIDPLIGIGFKLGPQVDSTGETPDGKKFASIQEFQQLCAADEDRLSWNLAKRMATYSIGREVSFSDRDALDEIMEDAKKEKAGLRDLIHSIVEHELFRSK